MDFNDTPQEAEYRARAKAWLADNAPEFEVKGPLDLSDEKLDEDKKHAQAWQATKADARYAFITWPKEYGGGGGSPIEAVIYDQEEKQYTLPGAFFGIAPFAGPTLMTYATEEQKRRYVKKMARGEEIWCQLFSEPAAGSDLAGLRTRADRDGDDWIINGQKVWTSGAQYSDYALLVTRHDPTVPKHRGMTYFFFDMKSPGVEIVPIRQISGSSNFNEVFLNDVRIPDSQRLGDVGAGWRVALTTLMNERLATGRPLRPNVEDLLELAQSIELEDGPASENSAVREKMADWYARSQGLKYTRSRTVTALSRGQAPGPEASIHKLVMAAQQQDISSFGADLANMGGIVLDPDLAPARAMFQQAYLGSPGIRIAGGTDEILRNIIGERVLGLPGDIRIDKEPAFDQLPTGAA